MVLVGGCLLGGQTPAPAAQQQGAPSARDLFVTAGKSLVVESPVVIQRVAVADSARADAIAVSPREVLVNGKSAGETSLIIWQQGGGRLLFDLRIQPSTIKLDIVRDELAREMGGQNVTMTLEDGSVFLRGTVKDALTAERAMAIASTLGKPVNLLRVNVPGVEDQILLRVRFANLDRAASQDLGLNLFSTGAGNTTGATSTGQFAGPQLSVSGSSTQVTLSDALNVFLFRPDLNLGATIRALQSRRLAEILAEPNVLAINGKSASFLAGGEFPVPVVQGMGTGTNAITIMWREFGVRLNFTPTIMPNGTIRLKVAPEVSSLDYNNAIQLNGFTVPAISTRKVQTEIQLEGGQSFAIAGLLDNRTTDLLNKIPGLGDIPVLGKLFQSRSKSKSNTELLVIVTPELVRPIPAGQPLPGVNMPEPFLSDGSSTPPRTPPMSVTGPVPVKPSQDTIPYEQLDAYKDQVTTQPPAIQWMPMMPVQSQPQAPAAAPAAAPAPATPGR